MIKRIVIGLCLIGLQCCGTATSRTGHSAADSTPAHSTDIPLTKQGQEALDSIQKMLSGLPSPFAERFDPVPEMDSSNTVLLPYYELDAEAFRKNPSPVGLIENLSPSKDLYFALKEGDTIKASFIAHQEGDFWEMDNYKSNRSKHFAWLPQVVNGADNREYKVFRLEGQEFFMFFVNGGVVFYNSLGEKCFSDELCADLVELIDFMKRNQEYIREKFPDKAKPTEL